MQNKCSIPFDGSFKQIIHVEKSTVKVQSLKECENPMQFERIQKQIRDHFKKNYPGLIHGKPDYFAIFISLVYPHLNDCHKWEDIRFKCLKQTFPKSLYNLNTVCACGQSMSANNSYVIGDDLKICVGSCCIEKNGIVYDFDRVKQERKRVLDQFKQEEQEVIKQWNDYTDRIKSYQPRCQYCRILVSLPFSTASRSKLSCDGCRTIHYDRCKCGKSKQKERPECYTCNLSNTVQSNCPSCGKQFKSLYKFCEECRDLCKCGKSKQKKYPTCFACKT
jgi:hypothetical protein